MRIAIISDIHENFHNLVLFLHEAEKLEIDKIIFLGDFMNNGIAKLLAASSIPVFAIRGNNDGDKANLMRTAMSPGSNLEIGMDTFDTIDIEKTSVPHSGRKIFLTHYPMLAKPMAKSGDFDAVFYGHDHKANLDKIGNCTIVNPGEIGAHKTGKASFALYDPATNEAEIIYLDGVVSTKTELSDNYREEKSFQFSKSKTHKY